MEINMNIQQNMSLMEKLSILTAAAKYDVACTSSGVDRRGNGTGMGNSLACGICLSNQNYVQIQQIAEECGYDSLCSFNRNFKHLTGRTPREMIKCNDNQK